MNYRIKPVGPLVMRDARPFEAGSRMHSLKWISQATIAGAVRTVLYKAGLTDTIALRKVKVLGGFPLLRERMYFPRPLDIVVSEKEVFQIIPLEIPARGGADMPIDGLMPCAPDTSKDFKPDKLEAFWSRELMVKWLKDGSKNFTLEECETLSAPSQDERTHVKINPESGTAGLYAGEGRLFTTTGLDFLSNDGSLAQEYISIDIISDSLPQSFTAPLGGERRIAEFSRCDDDGALWAYPEALPKEYTEGETFRLVLATPAIFAQGWLPGWLSVGDLTGEFPGTRAIVRLESAATDRWQPVSGWDYETENHKPMRRAVPAGSVYFFKVLHGTIKAADVWLKSVCDDMQDINDGFGLGLLGR